MKNNDNIVTMLGIAAVIVFTATSLASQYLEQDREEAARIEAINVHFSDIMFPDAFLD